LPEDIVILESDEVPAEFHATFSAVSKRYRYVILNRQVNDPFLRRYAWKISQPLDVASMQAAAQCLVGTHDFRSFESHWPNKATSVRTVQSVTVQAIRRDQVFFPDRLPDPSESNELHPELIALEIEADGFLYNMVRTITGTLSYVGRGTWTAADVQRVLQAQNRTIAGGTAPACGLMMVKVFYDDQNLGNQRPELRKTDA
jgi:tRNA pseudouridine38-40 synthase